MKKKILLLGCATMLAAATFLTLQAKASISEEETSGSQRIEPKTCKDKKGNISGYGNTCNSGEMNCKINDC